MSLAQTIALSTQYVISAMVLVSKAVKKSGLENSAKYHAHITVEPVTSLISHLVPCAKKTFTVTAVNIHAMKAALLETDRVSAIKSTVHVILTAKPRFGTRSAKDNAVLAVVEIFATELTVIALVSA